MFIIIWLRLHISRSVWDKYWNIYLKGGVIVTVEPTYLEERHHSGDTTRMIDRGKHLERNCSGTVPERFLGKIS